MKFTDRNNTVNEDNMVSLMQEVADYIKSLENERDEAVNENLRLENVISELRCENSALRREC